MPRRKQKRYRRPRKLYDKARIKDEDILVKKYGLKNKREIWRADFAVSKIRENAKKLIGSSEEVREKFIGRQKAKGFEVKTIADILSLGKEDYLKRRLQSIVAKKKIARTPKQARQMITHKRIAINGFLINAPSHLTTIDEEKTIEFVFKNKGKGEGREEKKLEAEKQE